MGWFFGDEESLQAEIDDAIQKGYDEFHRKGDTSFVAQIELAMACAGVEMELMFVRASHQLKAHHDKLEVRIAALEASIAELQSNAFEYRGVFEEGAEYRKNAVVTHDGGLWIAVVPKTNRVPGASPDWRLAVRKGRDGKDLRAGGRE